MNKPTFVVLLTAAMEVHKHDSGSRPAAANPYSIRGVSVPRSGGQMSEYTPTSPLRLTQRGGAAALAREAEADMLEQETTPNVVSILSMHQAEGLTFDVCFIVGAEDEFIPGKDEGEFIGDARRLLESDAVSLEEVEPMRVDTEL